MKVYNYHKVTGQFISEEDADESPLEPGVFLIPGSATLIKPPEYDTETQICRFVDSEWVIEIIPGTSEDDKLIQQIVDIKNNLIALDFRRIRPLAEQDWDFLETLNNQAIELRTKMHSLEEILYGNNPV